MRRTDNSDCERPDVVTKLVQINRVATRQFSFDLRRDCNLFPEPTSQSLLAIQSSHPSSGIYGFSGMKLSVPLPPQIGYNLPMAIADSPQSLSSQQPAGGGEDCFDEGQDSRP